MILWVGVFSPHIFEEKLLPGLYCLKLLDTGSFQKFPFTTFFFISSSRYPGNLYPSVPLPTCYQSMTARYSIVQENPENRPILRTGFLSNCIFSKFQSVFEIWVCLEKQGEEALLNKPDTSLKTLQSQRASLGLQTAQFQITKKKCKHITVVFCPPSLYISHSFSPCQSSGQCSNLIFASQWQGLLSTEGIAQSQTISL